MIEYYNLCANNRLVQLSAPGTNVLLVISASVPITAFQTPSSRAIHAVTATEQLNLRDQ